MVSPVRADPTSADRSDAVPPQVWAAALSVSERLELARGAGTPLAAALVGQWRAQAPFQDEALWQRRLEMDEITDEDLTAALAVEPPDVLAELPADLQEVVRLLRTRPASAPDTREEYPFLEVAAPLLADAHERVDAVLRSLGALVADPAELLLDLVTPVARQVNDMLMRPAVLELNIARVKGTLTGADSAERYADFAGRLRTDEFRTAFFATYPVLARQTLLAATQWADAAAALLGRLRDDMTALRKLVRPAGGELGPVTAISCGLGDRHRGGHTVARVSFRGGDTVIYKPRSLTTDAHFEQLVAWLNARGQSVSLRAVRSLVREGYGWQEEIKQSYCRDEAERRRFYHRQGALLCLLYLLSANDFHLENLIAAGEYPCPIDLESLAQPELALQDTRLLDLEEVMAALTAKSVLRIGMLPSRGWEQAGRPGADISGIGGWSGQRSGLRMPFPVNVGTDLMQVRLDEGDTEGAANQPAPDLKPRDLLAYTENLVAGFTEVYHALLAAQDELLAPGGPVAAFAGDHVRVLARHTKYYAVLHVASYHPDILRDGAVRDRHYDRLWAEVANVPALANFIRGEREDLRRNDIPVFTAELGGTDVLTADGERVPGLIRKSGLQAVEERVRSLDEDDLQRQVWLIRASMAAAATDLSPALVYPSYPLDRTPAPERPTGAELVETADEIAQRLLAVAFRDGRQAEWLGTNSARGQSWSIGTLGPDLYHGLTGVGVFFAAIGAATGDPAYLGITRDIRRTVELQLARGTLSGMGGTSGLPGHLYGARLIAAQLGEDDPVAAVPDLAIRLLEVIDLDAEFDVSSGAAGTILQLRHQGRWARGDLRGTVVAAADALCAAQDPVTGGWLAPSMVEIGLTTQPLAGLAHGAAGGAWALLEAERLTGESRYRDAALRAFDYERTLFLPEFQNWHDVRDPYILSGGRDGEQPPPIVAWCHGAAGIALARARGADLLSAAELSDVDDEIHAGVTTVLSEGFGTNHSLCHGDLGNLDVVRQTAADAPDWSQSADRMLARIVQSLRLDGPLCGMPQGVETPGLMTGLAGIGYGLLNAADPGRWPSVLSYDLPE